MHKQGAVLVQSCWIAPGDKIKIPGRGPWAVVRGVSIIGLDAHIRHSRGTKVVDAGSFLRVIRKKK